MNDILNVGQRVHVQTTQKITVEQHGRRDHRALHNMLGDSNNLMRDNPAHRSPVAKLYDSAKRLDPRKQLKPGSKRASTLTVVTSMVGGGVLALPYGMYNAGFVFTLLYFVIFAFMTAWSVYGVILIGQKTQANTFYDIAKALYSPRVAIFIELILMSILILAAVAYLTMVKNLLPLALQIILHTDEDYIYTSANFLIPLITIVVIAPLALMNKVAALRYASLCGFTLVIYLSAVTIYTYFIYCDKYSTGCLTSSSSVPSVWEHVDYYGISWTAHMYTIPLIISSYAAHPTVLPIYIELQRKSPKDMWVVITTGLSLATIVYIVLSSFGYFTFISDTNPNYLLNNYHHSGLVVIAAIGLCFVCSLAIPLFIHAKRRSIKALYFNHFWKEKSIEKALLSNEQKSDSSAYDSSEESESSINSFPKMVETPELAYAAHRPESAMKRKKPKKIPPKLPMWANLVICLGFLSVEATVSLYLSNIGAVLAFLGSTTFPLGCYVFPTFALWKLHAQYPEDKDINMKLLIIVTSSTIVVSILGFLGLLVQFKIIT